MYPLAMALSSGRAPARFHPHCDRANRDSYDVSALLYLSTAGEHFSGGGEFAFNDDDRDRLVEPREGRVLVFSSGFENLHQVRLDGGWRRPRERCSIED